MNACPSPGARRTVRHKVGQVAVKGAQYARGLRHDGGKIKRRRRALPYDISLRRCLMRHHGPLELGSSQFMEDPAVERVLHGPHPVEIPARTGHEIRQGAAALGDADACTNSIPCAMLL